VSNTPPMNTPPNVEKVTTTPPGAGPTPPGGDVGKSKGKGLGGLKLDKKTAMIGGAVVVGLIALLSSRGGDETSEPLEVAELDTTATDIYTDLQPELERLTDAIDGMRNTPAPAKPAPAPTGQKPRKPKSAPKPKGNTATGGQGKKKSQGRRKYRVQNGDTLSGIAKRFKVKGGHVRLYKANRAAIEQAARANGRKGSQAGRWIYPGTVLVIP
jgi:hypothetical protein